MKRAIAILGFVAWFLVLQGCGRYAPPLSPDKLAPKAVGNFTYKAELRGVKFDWEAPREDLRGKELKQIDGYRIYRKEIGRESDITDPRVDWVELAFLPDSHLIKLEELREAAREEGKIARRVKVDPALKAFQYTDVDVRPGKVYLYKIVPVNQGGLEGRVEALIRVLFRGESSEIQALPETVAVDDFEF